MTERATRALPLLLVVAAMDQLAIAMSQQGLSILSLAFKAYSRLSVEQMGLLFATVALGAVAGMIPAGLGLDRFGAKSVAIASGLWILLVMGALGLFLPRAFWVLEILLALVGLALPALSLTGTTAISRQFEGSGHEGAALGIRQAATPLGGILAASLFPLLVQTWSLSTVLLLIAVNAGGWTLLFARFLPPRAPGAGRAPRTPSPPLLPLARRLRRPLLVSLLLAPGQYALLTYALLDLHEQWHLRTESAGLLLATALFAGFLTRIAMGRRQDRGHNARRLIGATALFGVLALVVWALVPEPLPYPLLVLLFVALGAGLDGWNALLTTWVAMATQAAERGLALGLTGMAGFVGVVLFLPVFGWLVKEIHSYRLAWLLLAAIYAAAVAVLRTRSAAVRGAGT